jgi:hypothetical protein
MRVIYLILAVFAVSCSAFQHHQPQQQPLVATNQHLDHPPEICRTVTAAINKGDWATLRTFVKPGTHMDEYITALENATKNNHPVQVGKLLNVQTVAQTNDTSINLYSFSLENKDGTINPHWLQIKVRENVGQDQVLDFWNFGW